MELLTELQPLLNKKADTIGYAMIQVIEKAIRTMIDLPAHEACTRVRVIHLCTGDGIGTNVAALRRVAHRFMKQRLASFTTRGADASHGHLDFRYSLVEWSCAAHCGNLSVHVAICGK